MMKRFVILFVIFFLSVSFTPAQGKILILDYLMSDPILFKQFLIHLPEHNFKVDYRRYYPSLTESDKDYEMIILAASRFPFPSPSKMTLAEKDFLVKYVTDGGILVSLYSNEENDRIILNELLDSLDVPVRIEGKAIHDQVNGYKSTLLPSAYYLDPPMLQVHKETLPGNGVEKIFGGRAFSLLVDKGENISIPVTSFETSMRLKELDENAGIKSTEGIYSGGPYANAVMAVVKTGKGFIVLLPRYLINMNGWTTRWSDKPVIPTGFLQENEKFEMNFIKYLASLLKKENVFVPFNPITRWDNLKGFQDKPVKVVLEKGELAITPPPDVNDSLRYTFDTGRELKIQNQSLNELVSKKIRSAFFGMDNQSANAAGLEKICKYLSEAGFNLIEAPLQASTYKGLKNDSAKKAFIEDLRFTLSVLKKYNLKLLAGPNLPNPDYFKNKSYSKTASVDGVENGSPSPLDIKYWNDAVRPIAIELAKLSNEFPNTLLGSFNDMELYGFESLTITEAFSFDYLTYNEFVERKKTFLQNRNQYDEALNVLPHLRFDWLKKNGLLKIYFSTLEDAVAAMAKQLDVEVRKINPGFVWSFYTPGIPQSWYYKGLWKGLSSPERPVLLITYEGRGKQQVDYLASDGIYLIHCPGLLMNTLKGKEWRECLSGFASNENGYWLFPGYSMLMDENWKYGRNDWSILQPPDELFKILKETNEMIESRSRK